jgi:broad specificity phosphatase PhoE
MNKRELCTIYIVRHGQSEANVQDRYGMDTPLTDTGREQARLVRDVFAGIHFDAVFSSPLVRARETAEIIARERKLEILTREALRERFYGKIEGRLGREIKKEFAEIHTLREKSAYEDWKQVKMVEGYESDEEIMSRFITALREIAVAYSGKTVLVTNHVSMMKTFLIHLGLYTRQQLRESAFANTGYIKLESDGVDFFVKETSGLKVH